MKTVTCCCLIAIVLSTGTASAQVLLNPQTEGYVGYRVLWTTWWRSYTSFCNTLSLENAMFRSNTSFRRSYSFHSGVIEFIISQTAQGTAFPLPGMTENNWVAYLNGLSVCGADPAGIFFAVDIYDLLDSTEDGSITKADFNSTYGSAIDRLYDYLPPLGDVLNPVNVTEELRRDLFGSGTGDVTTGFYLKTFGNNWDGNYEVIYDTSQVHIEVFIDTTPTPGPTKTPTNTPTRTPTRTMTPVPTCTPTPTPTATPVMEPVVRIWMPSDHYVPDQLTACFVSFRNSSGPLLNMPLFVVLDVHGQIFFAPGFNDFSFYLVTVPALDESIHVLEPFYWPWGCGSAEGIRWYAALTDPSMTQIISNIDTFTFGWSD